MSIKVYCAISAIWRHANQQIQFSDDWEWSNDIDDDLACGFSELNFNTKPEIILKNFRSPENWEIVAISGGAFNPDDFEPASIDISELAELIAPIVDWDTYYDTIIVPFRLDPNKWMQSDTLAKLIAMGQVGDDSTLRTDGVIATSFNSGYFDYYVNGCIELNIEVESDDKTEATELASKEIKKYLLNDFRSEIERLLPEMEGDLDFDESIQVFAAPNWVLIQR